MVAPFFVPKIGEDQKKRSSLQNKWVCGPKVREDQKKRSSPKNQWIFSPNGWGLRMGTTKQSEKSEVSPQIGGVMVSHHNMVLPQNDDTRDKPPPPPLATPLFQIVKIIVRKRLALQRLI